MTFQGGGDVLARVDLRGASSGSPGVPLISRAIRAEGMDETASNFGPHQ
jgi:hypothetical protein